MGRLLGIILILGGSAGCLYSWQENEKRKRAFMEECIRMFAQWNYAVEKGHMRLYDFLECYDSEWDEMKIILSGLKDRLSENLYANGKTAWQEVLGENKKILPIKGEAYEILLSVSDSFFGNSSMDCLRCIQISRERMEDALKDCRSEYVKKQKVYMPLGMLGGLVLIIFLV